MTEILHKMAQRDTPEGVNVPKNAWAFAAWVIAKLGGWGVLLAFLLYTNEQTKQEVRTDKQEITAAYRQQIEVNVRLLGLMEGMKATMEELAREARSAHRWVGPANNSQQR
jgi:uncharacterized protein with von Willebrand factor type A (vWA) domain